MWFGGRSASIFISGIVLTILGLIPLLARFNVLKFNIPLIPQIIMAVLVAGSGIYLLVVGVLEGPTFNPGIAWTSIVLGALLAILSGLQIFGVLPAVNQALQNTIAYGVFVVVGILFIIGAFLQS